MAAPRAPSEARSTDNHCMSIQTDDFSPAPARKARSGGAASPFLEELGVADRVVGASVASSNEDALERALDRKSVV